MTITAKNVGRIDIWPTYDIARDADTEESKYVGRLTVWRTAAEARAHLTAEEGEGEGEPRFLLTEEGDLMITEEGDSLILED